MAMKDNPKQLGAVKMNQFRKGQRIKIKKHANENLTGRRGKILVVGNFDTINIFGELGNLIELQCGACLWLSCEKIERL